MNLMKSCEWADEWTMLPSLIGYLLILTPSNTVHAQDLDLMIPKGPAFFADPEVKSNYSGTDLTFLFTAQNPGILSFDSTQISNREVSISKLPKNLVVGSQSLFYRKDSASGDFVFTNNSRTYVYYGSTRNIDVKACGPFSQISDIHLTETAGGSTNYMIVSDKGANTVYSFVLTPSSATQLCTSLQSVSIERPEWIRSIAGANPTVFIGYRDSTGLKVRSYQASDLSPLTTVKTVSTQIRAQFGQPLLDPTSSDLLIPVRYVDTGDLILRYVSSLASSTSINTCRAPQNIEVDFEGASRYFYVYCPETYRIQILNNSNQEVLNLSAGTQPRKLSVGSDSLFRFVSILQRNNKVLLYKIDVTDDTSRTSSTLDLSNDTIDLSTRTAAAASADYLFTLSSRGTYSQINLNTQATLDTIALPRSITSLATQSSSIAHFCSKADNSAYTLTESSSYVWTLRTYNVGTSPIQVGYRTNRLYTLNQGSNSLSVVNLTTNAVSSLSTGTKPVAFDFSTTVDRLWVANETSQSVSVLDITVGAEATAAGSPVSLGFTPSKIKYQSSDATLYVGGGTSLRAIDAASLTTVTTQTLNSNLSELMLHTNGVSFITLRDYAMYIMTRTTLSTVSQSARPHLLVSNGSVSIAAFLGAKALSSSAGYTQSFKTEFTRAFSTSLLTGVYFPSERTIRLFPYSLMASDYFPSLDLEIDLDPDLTSFDSSNNLWLVNANQMKLRKISSSYQKNLLSNQLLNRPEDIEVWDAQDKIYVALRNQNAVAIIDATGSSSTEYVSVCQSPRKIILDTSQTPAKLFVLCTESNSLSVLTLSALGAFSSQSLVQTGKRPVAMALNTSSARLYIANHDSNTVSMLNSNTHASVASYTVNTGPRDLALDTTTGNVYVASENSNQVMRISSLGVQTNFSSGSSGFYRIVVNPSSAIFYATNYSTKGFFIYPSYTIVPSGSVLTSDERPGNLAVNSTTNKIYITYPDIGVLSILNETGVQKDLSVGGTPLYSFPLNSASKVFVSNFEDDTLSVVGTATDTLSTTISLTSGCGPTRMNSLTTSGTTYLYVLCQSGDSVEVVNTSSNAVSTPLSLRISP